MEILCVYCGDLFEASPRHKNQIACKKPACQRARKVGRFELGGDKTFSWDIEETAFAEFQQGRL
jgi:hypothetical protein